MHIFGGQKMCKINSHERPWLITKIQEMCFLHMNTEKYQFSCNGQAKNPWVEELTGLPSGVNVCIVNFTVSDFLVEKLTIVISFGNCSTLSSLWLAIPESKVIQSSTSILFHSLCTDGQTTHSSEQVSGSATEILYSWHVGKDIDCFTFFESFQTNIL